MKAQAKGADLGVLQAQMESCAKGYRASITAFKKASDAMNRAEEAYINASKALAAGLEQVKASTKVV